MSLPLSSDARLCMSIGVACTLHWRPEASQAVASIRSKFLRAKVSATKGIIASATSMGKECKTLLRSL